MSYLVELTFSLPTVSASPDQFQRALNAAMSRATLMSLDIRKKGDRTPLLMRRTRAKGVLRIAPGNMMESLDTLITDRFEVDRSYRGRHMDEAGVDLDAMLDGAVATVAGEVYTVDLQVSERDLMGGRFKAKHMLEFEVDGGSRAGSFEGYLMGEMVFGFTLAPEDLREVRKAQTSRHASRKACRSTTTSVTYNVDLHHNHDPSLLKKLETLLPLSGAIPHMRFMTWQEPLASLNHQHAPHQIVMVGHTLGLHGEANVAEIRYMLEGIWSVILPNHTPHPSIEVLSIGAGLEEENDITSAISGLTSAISSLTGEQA